MLTKRVTATVSKRKLVLLKAQLDATNAFPFTGQQPSITAFSTVNATIVLAMRLNLIWHDYTCYQQRFNIIYHSHPSKHRAFICLYLLHCINISPITFTFNLYKQWILTSKCTKSKCNFQYLAIYYLALYKSNQRCQNLSS